MVRSIFINMGTSKYKIVQGEKDKSHHLVSTVFLFFGCEPKEQIQDKLKIYPFLGRWDLPLKHQPMSATGESCAFHIAVHDLLRVQKVKAFQDLPRETKGVPRNLGDLVHPKMIKHDDVTAINDDSLPRKGLFSATLLKNQTGQWEKPFTWAYLYEKNIY